MKMKLLTCLTVFFLLGVCITDASTEALQSSFVFKAGQSIVLRLRYAGGIKNWDAGFEMQKDSLVASNSGAITLIGSDGTIIAPRKDKILNLQYDQIMAKPFNFTVEITTLYDLSTTGVYTLEWGCKQVRTEVMRIEIVE